MLLKEARNQVIGLNIGNGFIKGRCAERYMPKTPSLAVNVQETLDFEGFGGGEDDFIIEYEGIRYAIGYSALRLNQVAEANRGANRITSDYYRILFLAALTKLAPFDGRQKSSIYEPTSLVVVAPITSYQNDKDSIKQSLSGNYEVGIVKGGKVKRSMHFIINPDALRIVPEGFSTIAGLTITEDAIPHDPIGYSQGNVGIVNFGTGTTDLMFFSNMRLVPAKCDGRPIGISNVWNELRRWARKNYNLEMTDYQIDEALEKGYFMVANQTIDLRVDNFIQSTLYNTASQGLNLVASAWNEGRDCQFLLVSGGAGDRFFHFVKERFVHAECVMQPVHAEANGAYLYGLMRVMENAQ